MPDPSPSTLDSLPQAVYLTTVKHTALAGIEPTVKVICGNILIYYSDLRSSEPEIMLICGDLRFSGRP